MNLFNSKQTEQLAQQVAALTASLEAVTKERDSLQANLHSLKLGETQRQVKLAQAEAEAAQAKKSLLEFEQSLSASLEQLGHMVNIGGDQWLDPLSVWHLDVVSTGGPEGQHALVANKQNVTTGSREWTRAKLKQVIEAKLRAAQQ